MAYQMPDASADTSGWFYALQGQQQGRTAQQGPVSWNQLQELVKQGWLTADDLVWHHDLPDWMPASELPGLFATGRVLGMLRQANARLTRLASHRRPRRGHEPPSDSQAAPSVLRVPTDTFTSPKRVAADKSSPCELTDEPFSGPEAQGTPPDEVSHFIERTKSRHLLAIAGAMLTVLSGVFLLVRPTVLAWALLTLGLLLLFFCLLPEILFCVCAAGMAVGRFLMVVVAEFHSARRRAEAQQDVVLHDAAIRRQRGNSDTSSESNKETTSQKMHPGVVTRYQHDSLRGLVSVHEPAIKLWSRPVAGVLSVCPGLGHIYKRQYFGGLVWGGCVFAAYFAHSAAGVVLHMLCIAAAASGANWSEAKNWVQRES